jgi:hypothetical protein
MPRLSQGLTVQNQQRLQSEVHTHIVRPLWPVIRRVVEQGATFEQADAHVQAWVADGTIAMVLVPLLHDYIQRELAIAEWERVRRQPMFGANQREAQLASDPQNVHTHEITQQMKDAVNLLVAVQIPKTQTNTISEIQAAFVQQK